MIDEPQTLVWLPTLHRLAMSETGAYANDVLYICTSLLQPLVTANPHKQGRPGEVATGAICPGLQGGGQYTINEKVIVLLV